MYSRILGKEITLEKGDYSSLNPSMDEKELISVQRKSAKVREYKVKFQTEIDISIVAHSVKEAKEKALELKNRDLIDQFTGSNSSLRIVNIKHETNSD